MHLLSPEFDPAWRMVTEYANGRYGWVPSLMFATWAVSSWALAFAIRSQVRTRGGRIGLGFLIVAGVGGAMAAVFDINQPLHDLAGLLGIGGLPVAAVLISVVVMAATFAIMTATYLAAGGDTSAKVLTVLPPGVIALVGWTNRRVIVAYCAWVITVAWKARKLAEA